MKNKKEEPPMFSIPESFLEQLYEFSGGVDKYKGIFLAYCDEYGSPNMYCRYDSIVVDLGLEKAITDYFKNSQNKKINNDL
jgi:hypothetical protein